MAKGSNTMAMVGGWAFILGVIVALLIGIFAGLGSTTLVSILILLGLIVGFLNVSGGEATKFLLAAVSLVIVSTFGGSVLSGVAVIGPVLQNTLGALIVFVIPATIIVALKTVYSMARDA